jgi:amino acid adenylation domain-containing protein
MNDPLAISDDRRRLLEALLAGDGTTSERISRRGRDDAVPLSAEQLNVWLHSAMSPEPLYNEAITIHRFGSFDLGVLRRSLNALIARHEVWRTNYEARDGRICAIVRDTLTLDPELVDLSGLPEAERERRALEIATAEARPAFDLGRGPLLRAKVVRMAPDAHRIYITLHHIIFDGVAIYRVVVPELAALYDAFARGEEPALPELQVQYGDYAIWRERQLGGPAVRRALDYWRGKLADLPAELKLPVDRLPSDQRHRGAMVTFELSPATTASLKSLSLERHVTLYVTLLAAFKAMLYRYTGQEDVAIGGATDMRSRPELERTVGYFLNSFVLRTRPCGDLRFVDYLAEVQRTVIEAVDAASVPFDRVVRAVRPARQGTAHPLFQVLFSMEPPVAPFPDGWSLTQMDVAIGATKFDLYLELDEQDERVIGRFIYSSDLFDRATIERMVGHWRTILDGVRADPECRLKDLPMLTAAEIAEHAAINATTGPIPVTTLHGAVAAQAGRTPDAIAVQGDGGTWTYAELRRHAGGVARALSEAGIRRGDLVAVAMDRSPAMVAGLLGILEAGAAWLPLDPELPAARLELLIGDGKPLAILTQPSIAQRLPPIDAPLVLYCGDTADGLDVAVAPDDLAYVLFTSGSTGRPKAVEIEHRSVINLLASVRRDLDFGPHDGLLAVTTLSFDIAALELFLPLISGGRLVVAGKADTTEPFRLIELMARSSCTVMQATPSLWRALVHAGWAGDPRLKALCGGDVLARSLAAELGARVRELWNMYGPTETTIWSLRHRVTSDDAPIGRPLANTTVHVVDRDGNPVPAGIPGELLIGGAGVARGYRGDAALTARKFVALAGERLYRTGDTVRRRPDGALEFLGRSDNQVKVRGFRVGLEEIEEALVRCPGVTAAAVAAVPDASGQAGLAAFIVGAGTPADWQRTLHRRLPAYMVPTRYQIVPALPMTASGKIDRARLPRLDPGAAADHTVPRDALERSLAGFCQDLLGISEIGIHDDFFELGGHSLLAFMLLSRIKAVWGRELSMATLFKAPTVAGLANLLRRGEQGEFSHLVCLKQGTGRPLFIVHGILGNVVQLAPLARLVRTERPIWALQARGVDARFEPHRTIDEMAEAYLAAIRSLQPEGPYSLAGYSFGGLIAFDMAVRLRRRGAPVDLLALFESDLHERHLPLGAKIAYQWTLARRVVRSLAALPRAAWLEYLRAKLRKLKAKFETGPPEVPELLQGVEADLAERYRQMYEIGLGEFRRFRPRRYDGPLSVFAVPGERFDACDPLPIWRRAARTLEVFRIDGDHSTIMDPPHVQSLADQLTSCLARHEAGNGAAGRGSAAVDHELPAGRVGSKVGAEEQHHVGDLLGGGIATGG